MTEPTCNEAKVKAESIFLHEIIWGHQQDSELYAKGHHDPAAFVVAYGRDVGLREEELPSLVPHVVHLWGRWTPSRGEFDRKLHVCDGPGRGAFAFTMIES